MSVPSKKLDILKEVFAKYDIYLETFTLDLKRFFIEVILENCGHHVSLTILTQFKCIY